MMRSATTALRALLPDLVAGRMPPQEAIVEAAATIAEIDKVRAEMKAAEKALCVLGVDVDQARIDAARARESEGR